MCHIHSVKQQSNLYLLTKNTKQKHQFFFMNIPYLSAYKHISHASLFNIATLQHTLSIQTLDSMLFPYYIVYRESERAPLSLYISCVMERGYNKLVRRLRRTKIHALFRPSGHGLRQD
jgi:hypothetical protein